MRITNAFLFLLFTASIVSCQKDINIDLGSGDKHPGDLLVKTVSKTGTDSVVTTFGYDGSGRLINENISGMLQGYDVSNDLKIIRNNAGIITKVVHKSPTITQNGFDSVLINVFYDVSRSRYSYTKDEFTVSGLILKDSIVYVYDGSARVIRKDIYLGDFFGGSSYDLVQKLEYNYDGNGNMTLIKVYNYNPNTIGFDLEGTVDVTYDTKVNPLRLSNGEAFVLDRQELYSANNVILVVLDDPINPANNVTASIAFTYNSRNRPATAVSTRMPDNLIRAVTFYYQ